MTPRARMPVAVVLLIAATAAWPGAGGLSLVQRQQYAMGTMFGILVYHETAGEAQQAIDRALAEVLRLEDVMSHFRADSELSRLNRDAAAGDVRVSPALYDVIERAQAISRRSRGAFDVTVAPLVRMWAAASERGVRPSSAELAAARRCVGYDGLALEPPDGIRYRSPCLQIELGAIGKGYAVDRALGVLASAGIRHALVNAGGSSIAAIGSPPGRTGWPVQLRVGMPERATLQLRDATISTSESAPPAGADKGAGEVVDPRTGRVIAGSIGASVIAATATVSDALSTALLVLPPDRAVEMLAGYDDVAAIWFRDDGAISRTYRAARFELPELVP